MIAEVLAGGFEAGEVAARQRAEAAEAAYSILEEVRRRLLTRLSFIRLEFLNRPGIDFDIAN